MEHPLWPVQQLKNVKSIFSGNNYCLYETFGRLNDEKIGISHKTH